MKTTCPLCTRPRPVYRSLCSRCARLIPPRMRKTHAIAFRSRIRNPAGYQESLIGLLLYRRDRGTRGHPQT